MLQARCVTMVELAHTGLATHAVACQIERGVRPHAVYVGKWTFDELTSLDSGVLLLIASFKDDG